MYQRSGAHVMAVEIDWTVTWTATDGSTGTLPPVSRGVSFAMPTDQRQAVITG